MKKTIPKLSLALLAATTLSVSASGPGASGTFGSKRAIILGIDGCRSDALKLAVENGTAPNIAKLIKNGSVTWNAYAGGDLGTPTQQVTFSGPGWSSIFTGVWTDKHLVTSNGFPTSDFVNYPHIFRRLHDADSTVQLSSVSNWDRIDDTIVERSKVNSTTEYLTFRQDVSSDTAVRDQAVLNITNSNPDALYVGFDDVDNTGHGNGYGPTVPAYMAAIANTDARIGAIITAIEARPQFANEDWIYVITTDHGGIGNGHGGQSNVERKIPFIASGGHVPKGIITNKYIGQTATMPTVLRHLEVNIPASWGFESNAFQIGSELTTSTSANAIHLHWQLPPNGIQNLTGFQLLKNGTSIATLPISARDYTDTAVTTGTGTVSYTLSLTGSNEAALTATGTLPTPTNPPVLDGPVLNLAFDNSLTDSSGNSNDASPSGTPIYVTGRTGQAIQLDATHGAFLGDTTNGAPVDLKFGATTDFTISFWIKATPGWSGDPALISNKNWASGANQGWIIAQENGGQDFQWNLKGADAGRKDFDPNGVPIQDGNWHHIAITHQRDGNATFFYDGVSISTVSINGSGDIDTNFPIRLGSDGNNNYAVNQPVLLDDLKIWRRSLGSSEVATEAGISASESSYELWITEQADLYNQDQILTAPNDDPDADGHTNLSEFAAGTLPFKNTSHPQIEITQIPNNKIQVTFAQRNQGTGIHGVDSSYTLDGLTYILETSTTLTGTWLPVTGTVTQNASTTTAGPSGSNTHKVTIEAPASSTGTFYRVNVAFAN